MKKIIILVSFIINALNSSAQTGIGTTTPHASAKLEVASDRLGFLPPQVSLSGTSDNTTIKDASGNPISPKVGLLVYNIGTVGLQAGYYYWNGANWATIATATSAGNGVTSMDMVKLYGEAHSKASGKIGNSTTGFVFSVPVSGRYLFDFTSAATTISAGMNTIYFTVRQGATVLASDMQSSYNNNVHVEYNGKVEVNLQAGVSYNVYNYATSGSFETSDYDRVYYKLVAGNLPVTGQSVDYVSVSTISQSSIGDNRDLIFTTNNGGNIPYNTSTGVFTLSANKTYLFQAQIRSNLPSAGGNYIEYGFVDATSNALLMNGTQTITSSSTSTAGFGSNPVINFIYTPTSNQTVKIRTTATTVGTQNIVSGTANITQIGSSAIINPWTLSGTNTFNTTGNVGIGNTSPTKVLDVTGDANVSGVLTAGGNAYPTSQGINGNALTTNGSGVASWNSLPPSGVISAFAGSSAPLGYLLCDGSAVSRTTYASLFSVIVTTYGSGNGSSTFNLPDLRSRTIVGVGQGASLTNRTLASTGGIESKTLSINEIPAHNHGVTDPGHSHTQTTVNDDFNNSPQNPPGFTTDGGGSRTWSNINSSTTGISINNAGGGNSFNLMNPFISLNYIIKF